MGLCLLLGLGMSMDTGRNGPLPSVVPRYGKRRGKSPRQPLFIHPVLILKTQPDGGSLSRHRGNTNFMPQIFTNPLAQKQPHAGSPPVAAPGAAGISPVENPGQILRCNADAGIPDAQLPLLPADCHRQS